MPAVIVVGAQWGDEGKGKIIDYLCAHAHHVVRSQGGNNAGHTIVIGNEEFKLHLLPSGILHEGVKCYIAAGVVINPEVLAKEINMLLEKNISVTDRLFISPAAHVILPEHIARDREMSQDTIGTTGSGIGPCYSDKANRTGVRLGETGQFSNYLCAVEEKIDQACKAKEVVLFEGAQGTFLDLNFGTYPYVTSTSTIAGGILAGAGIGPSRITHTLGVVKAYTTRVGHGPFPTEAELNCDLKEAREIATTTGRERRLGWFDAVMVKKAVQLNGLDSLALTKLDVLDSLDTLKICVAYKEKPVYETFQGWKSSTHGIKDYANLPQKACAYIERIEELCEVPVSLLSTGPERESTIVKRNPLEVAA